MLIVGLWFVAALLMSGYLLLRPSPLAKELAFLPESIALWLDEHADFRTFIMSLVLAIFPAVVLAHSSWTATRRKLLFALMIVLLFLEAMQAVLPRRTFSGWDLAYSIAGCTAVEIVVSCYLALKNRFSQLRQKRSSVTAEPD